MKEPVTAEIGAKVRGRVWKYGDHVNTDVIFPGKYTYLKHQPADVIEHALEDLDPEFVTGVQVGDLVVAGRNFGCGSSREQAATCLRFSGVGAVVAKSFGRIFYRNAINQGLLAIVCPEAVDGLEHGDVAEVDLERSEIVAGDTAWSFVGASPTLRAILEAGGLIPYTEARLQGSG